MFLFVVVSRQTKKAILCALCVSAVNKSYSALIGENLRLIIPNSLLLVFGPYCSVLSTRYSVLTSAMRHALSCKVTAAYCLP